MYIYFPLRFFYIIVYYKIRNIVPASLCYVVSFCIFYL